MKRKLWILNIVLLGLIAVLVFEFRSTWLNARAREHRVLAQRIPPAKIPGLLPVADVAPFQGVNYITVAQNFLFSADRNSQVIIDPVAPPPKPPMPPLPTASGLMMIGEPSIIMTEKAGARQKIYHAGDKVGEFKLLAFDREHVVLEWDGQKVERKLSELMKAAETVAAAPPPTPGVAAPQPAAVQSVVSSVDTNPDGPGVDVGGGYRGCKQGDTSAVGTIRDGYKKFEVASPFGKSCGWQKVN